MPEDVMNLSINGQSQVPPGFRFHPTEEELLHYYLRKKVAYEKIDLDVIREVDLNKLEPWDIQEKCKIGSTPQNDWYFFSHKDKKYPTGTRTNRATAAGFWKATGRDKIIYSGFRRIGLRKTLVFYKGRAPHGQKSDWIMHEYRLDETPHDTTTAGGLNLMGDQVAPEEGWVVCRVFRKKNYQKTLESPKGSSSTTMDSKTRLPILGSGNDGVLDQILLYMGKTCCKMESESFNNLICNNNNNIRFLSAAANHSGSIIEADLHERFIHLPRLESPTLPSVHIQSPSFDQEQQDGFKSYQPYGDMLMDNDSSSEIHRQGSNGFDTASAVKTAAVSDWVTLDRLVASQLNGGHEVVETSKQLSCFDGLSPDDDDDDDDGMQLSHEDLNVHRSNQLHSSHQIYGGENDLWSFTKTSSSPSSSSDPLCHLSV